MTVLKALGLFRKSNPSLMEWLQSPMVYIENKAVISEWQELAETYFNPKNVMYHYLNIARNTTKNYLGGEHLKLKKYFYAVRPLLACRWIEAYGTMPPVLFEEMLKRFDNLEIRAIIDKLVIDKKAGNELEMRPKIPLLNDFITNEIAYFDNLLKDFEVNKKRDSEDLNVFFRKVLRM